MVENIVYHAYSVNQKCRIERNGHRPVVFWFTGLSGSGKSSIASGVERRLFLKGMQVYALDGDNIRTGLNKDLGFTREDRAENLRRIAEVAKLMLDAGMIVLAAFVSPLKSDREMVKLIIGAEHFVEVFVNTSLEECERRDVKGLYKKARLGEIANFTGISAPYEAPECPDLELTEALDIEAAIEKAVNYITLKL
ncbi:adenylyl-sulfate kinase [Arachidicoccus ginsenosidivorans]|uniref:Adenylyl-sulfate kinase n=1 Tax=Arachidicoccus ginsenosidivorans TaxID=496057 RepID=A0A5B8VQM2_9BACT|nr:adenylyl-sulfate kinase [Arachidicoccus ginsenosidivorans]QEC73917.1 adenylyl-sulfate kinase [Arachidicoccus ginsenosidivorans]